MTVHLVGAGPGDPELLTFKAGRLLQNADVVVFDRLVSSEVLAMAPPWAELIDVGKNPNGHSTTQEEINAVLIDRGRRGAVVRLKGGDPFVFGRGGEEAEALERAGVATTVVPGISSAIAGPAAAGVPVTHRGRSSAFTVVTAHEDPNKDDGINWAALAQLGTTIVVMMGARRAVDVRDRLLGGDLPADTPTAIVIKATTPEQEIRHLSLGALGVTPVPNPAVIVIGEVAAHPVLTEHIAAESDSLSLTSPSRQQPTRQQSTGPTNNQRKAPSWQ